MVSKKLKMVAVSSDGAVKMLFDDRPPLVVHNMKLSDALMSAAEAAIAHADSHPVVSPCEGCTELATVCINCDPAKK
jgi:hypothetical protein